MIPGIHKFDMEIKYSRIVEPTRVKAIDEATLSGYERDSDKEPIKHFIDFDDFISRKGVHLQESWGILYLCFWVRLPDPRVGPGLLGLCGEQVGDMKTRSRTEKLP